MKCSICASLSEQLMAWLLTKFLFTWKINQLTKVVYCKHHLLFPTTMVEMTFESTISHIMQLK